MSINLKSTPQLLLASQSPRRRQLLQQIGISYELLLPSAAENIEQLEQVLPNELPADYVARVVQLKSRAAEQRRQRRLNSANAAAYLAELPILSADTIVSLDQRILGKPVDAADAISMLQQLSAKQHQVLTAVALSIGERYLMQIVSSTVYFAALTQSEIEHYVASGEALDKAGSYGIQGSAAQFVKKIDGSYTGIIGLPLYETKELLRQIYC